MKRDGVFDVSVPEALGIAVAVALLLWLGACQFLTSAM